MWMDVGDEMDVLALVTKGAGALVIAPAQGRASQAIVVPNTTTCRPEDGGVNLKKALTSSHNV
jgi:hypothetical protein